MKPYNKTRRVWVAVGGCGTVFPCLWWWGLAVLGEVCRWGRCPRCPGGGRCLLAVHTLHVEYAEQRTQYGNLFLFSLFYECITLEYVRIHMAYTG